MKRIREKGDTMTPENKKTSYWTLGIVGLLVVLAVLAYLGGYFDPAAPAAS